MNGTKICAFCGGTGTGQDGNCRICLGRGFMVLPEFARESFEQVLKDIQRERLYKLAFALLGIIVGLLLVWLCSGCLLDGDWLNKKRHGTPERSIPERRP